ncbi:IS607 family transposase [Actinokineospora sp.]|uniref:IS607 family transposase n=1 Tax=Actinokineospora sp. TaxID=1872133 RepID=UPI003D6B29F9
MKLSEWAREQGVSYRTALNWFHADTLPVTARQLPTGTILVDSPARAEGAAVAYCRVSGAEQRLDLERQAGRVAEECGARGITLVATVTEIGSGLDGNRVKLRKLLADPTVTTIVVEHRDRLARFGVEHLEAALSATGRRIIVLNPDEVKDDLMRDMVEVLTSMCARLYGARSARERADAAVKAAAVAR